MTESYHVGDLFWTPKPHHIIASNLSAFVQFVNKQYDARIPLGDQNTLHRWSVEHNCKFWLAVALFAGFEVHPIPKEESVIIRGVVNNGKENKYKPSLVNVEWFSGSTTNFVAPVLRHAALTPDRLAVVCRHEGIEGGRGKNEKEGNQPRRERLTFADLMTRVSRLANALRAAGVRKGDSVGAVMTNGLDAVIALLATAAVGAVWACCSADFGADAIVSRLAQTNPKVLFYTSMYIYKGVVRDVRDTIVTISRRLSSLRLVIATTTNAKACLPRAWCRRHVSLAALENAANINVDNNSSVALGLEKMAMSDAMVTMFSSGTTGAPKCIVQGSGILLNQMKEHALHLDVGTSSKMFFYTSTGWMLFNWLVAALAVGACIVLYDGAPHPACDPLQLVRIAVEERVTHFGCGAALLRSLETALQAASEADDKRLGKRASALQMLLATGSPSTADHFRFVRSIFPSGVRYVSMSGGTDINGCFALGTPWRLVRVPQLQCAGLGMDVAIYDDKGTAVVGKTGELVCRNACPCMPLHFGHDSDYAMYRAAYFESYGDSVWNHGDFAMETESGAFIISGRSDSTLNPGGVRIGTADIYEVVETIDFISDSLVTEITQPHGDTIMVMFVIVKDGEPFSEERKRIIQNSIRQRLSPKHVPRIILRTRGIPYTFSGKKCEIPVKKLLNGKHIGNKHAVKNPEAFDDMLRAFVQSQSRFRAGKL